MLIQEYSTRAIEESRGGCDLGTVVPRGTISLLSAHPFRDHTMDLAEVKTYIEMAAKRNVVVYDPAAETGELTWNVIHYAVSDLVLQDRALATDMVMPLRMKDKVLSLCHDVFCDPVEFHFLDNDEWGGIEVHYFDVLKGAVAAGDGFFFVMVGSRRDDTEVATLVSY